MGYLDLGGGLAVDYDGSHTNYISSRNYNLDEYSADIVEAIMSILDEQQVPHPHIITESGRATVAYYSVLLFNVLDVSAVSAIDSAGLAMLVALAERMQDARIEGVPSGMSDLLAAYRLRPTLAVDDGR